jgi:hypothetical protein
MAILTSFTVLIFLLLFQTLKTTKKQLKDYFNLPLLFNILGVSLVLSVAVYVVNEYFRNVLVLILSSCVYFFAAYFLLLKLKLIDLEPFSRFLRKLPKGEFIMDGFRKYAWIIQ